MSDNIQIDEEFKNLIPGLKSEELEKLEKSILEEGCRDPLIIWDNMIIDGHNRYNICMKHGLIFKRIEKNFDNRDDAKVWILENQLGRRNLNDAQHIDIVDKLFGLKEKQEAKERLKTPTGGSTRVNLPTSINKGRATDNLSKKSKVSRRTYEKGIKIKDNKPELWDKCLNGQLSIDKAYKSLKNENIEKIKEKILNETKKELITKPKIYHKSYDIFLNEAPPCDLLLTDPIYITETEDINKFVDGWLYQALSKVKTTGKAYIFIGAYPQEVQAYLNAKIPEHLILEQFLIWTYKNTIGQNPKEKYKQNYQICIFYRGKDTSDLNIELTAEQWAVQEINAPDGRQGDRFFKWQKPLELAERFIRHSTKEGDIVIDPFCGSGSFLIAANKLNRQGFGCDISKEAIEIAVSRGCELIE